MEKGREEQFLLLSTIFSYLMFDFYAKTRIRFSLREKQLFEITEVEITRVDCYYCTRWRKDANTQTTKIIKLSKATVINVKQVKFLLLGENVINYK